jgi:FAD binding domain
MPISASAAHGATNPTRVARLDRPPFYALRVIPSELGTFAGIRTNANAQVIDGDGRPIPGLDARALCSWERCAFTTLSAWKLLKPRSAEHRNPTQF